MTLLVSGIMFVAHLYLGWRLTRAAGFITRHPVAKWVPAALLLSFYLLPVSTFGLYAVYGQVDLLKFYPPITYWFWFGFAFTFQLLSWVIVWDVLKVFSHRVMKSENSAINRRYGWAVVATMCGMLIFTGIKMVRDTTKIITETVTLSIPGLPEHLEGFRIIHVSDIQGDEYTGEKDIAGYVEKINQQQPDLVIFTGDLVSYGTEFIEMSAREFGKVRANYGVYAVVGDHDYWAGLTHIEPALENNGIPLLKDENRVVRVGKDSLLLTGITHVYSQQAVPEDVKKLTSDPVQTPVRILASHQISDLLISRAEQNGYDLLLAGHTHGGQVRVPLFGKTFSAADMETSFVSGQYREGNLFININSGLGFTLAPVRYNAPPAISVIELAGG